MNKILTICIVAISVFLTACGGSSGGNDSTISPTTSTAISMVPHQTYTIHAGQSIRKDSTPTEVIVETDTNTGSTKVTLKSGSASILSKN